MTRRIALTYVGLAVAVVVAWQLGAIPGWVAGAVLAGAAMLLMAAAYFGFTRPDEGRHLATEGTPTPSQGLPAPLVDDDVHRDKSHTLTGWLRRVLWPDSGDGSEEPTLRIDSSPAEPLAPALPDAIRRNRGDQ